MVTLKNTLTKTPANSNNTITFKQINTESYEMQKVQDNIEESFNNLSELLNNIYETTLANVTEAINYSTSAIPVQLFFRDAVTNPLQSYDAQTSTFEAPVDGVYATSLDCLFKITSGAPTFGNFYINSSQAGILTTVYITPINNVFSVNVSSTLKLNSGDKITFLASTPIGSTLEIQLNSRISFTTVQ